MQIVVDRPPPLDERQQLVVDHYPLARSIACKVHKRLPRTIDVDDLISAAVTGLIEAIDRYDHDREVPFVVFARHRMHGAVLDALRAQDWVPRSVRQKSDAIVGKRRQLTERLGRSPTRAEMAGALNVTPNKFDRMDRDAAVKKLFSLDAPVGGDNPTPLVEQLSNSVDLLQMWQDAEMKSLAVEATHRLPERERVAVLMYYLHELSLKEVGEVLGVTESRACQLCAQGIRRLRYKLRRLRE